MVSEHFFVEYKRTGAGVFSGTDVSGHNKVLAIKRVVGLNVLIPPRLLQIDVGKRAEIQIASAGRQTKGGVARRPNGIIERLSRSDGAPDLGLGVVKVYDLNGYVQKLLYGKIALEDRIVERFARLTLRPEIGGGIVTVQKAGPDA